MKVLLLLAALVSPAVAATSTPPSQPVASPPRASSVPDDRQEAPARLPSRILNDDRRIQMRPGSTKPNPEGKPGPGIG